VKRDLCEQRGIKVLKTGSRAKALWGTFCISHCITWQHTATRCNALQRPATPCNALQRAATEWDQSAATKRLEAVQKLFGGHLLFQFSHR